VVNEIARLDPEAIDVLGGPVAISAPVVQALAQLAPTTRRSGPDRYATSAAISAANFSAPVERLYLATGINFPDGLAASGVARRHGSPVLLVPNWCIPASVAAEAARLQPRRVIVLGGPNAIHPAVLAGQPCPT
jgi:putative cell wall-binding protein